MLISVEDDFLITSGPGLHCLVVPYEWYAPYKGKKVYLSTVNPVFSGHSKIYQTKFLKTGGILMKKSEYDQEIPQSQTADNPVAPRGRAAQPSRDTRKTN